MTQMRKIIAQRMIESRRTSAHVHCMFEVDITRIVHLRNKNKSAFEKRHGARLTFMPFFARAVIITLQQFPIVNASIEAESIRYHRNINLASRLRSIGTDRSGAEECRRTEFLSGLQRGISDPGERARAKN
jgi:2-oxoglutarate dehydrogenase E2 component (dihydrolipoamide succinyltransferase)